MRNLVNEGLPWLYRRGPGAGTSAPVLSSESVRISSIRERTRPAGGSVDVVTVEIQTLEAMSPVTRRRIPVEIAARLHWTRTIGALNAALVRADIRADWKTAEAVANTIAKLCNSFKGASHAPEGYVGIDGASNEFWPIRGRLKAVAPETARAMSEAVTHARKRMGRRTGEIVY